MILKALSLAAAALLLPAAAFAQSTYTSPGVTANERAPEPNNSHIAAGTAARDGCVNVPGEAHNSADCSKIDASDLNTAVNREAMAGDRPSGATENAARNARILSGQAQN